MKKIRKDVFETNSSSTHALTLGRPLGKDYVSPGKYLKIKWFDEEELCQCSEFRKTLEFQNKSAFLLIL